MAFHATLSTQRLPTLCFHKRLYTLAAFSSTLRGITRMDKMLLPIQPWAQPLLEVAHPTCTPVTAKPRDREHPVSLHIPESPGVTCRNPQPCLLQGTRTATQINSIWSAPGDGFICSHNRGGDTTYRQPCTRWITLLALPFITSTLFKHLLNTSEIPFKVSISGLTVPAQSSSIVPPLLLGRVNKAQFAPKSL